MSKKSWLLISIAITLLSCALLGSLALIQGMRWWERSQLTFIEKATGLVFPAQISEIDSFDNGESFVVAHVKLSKADLSTFTQKYGFFAERVEVTPWIETLKPENRSIPAGASWRYLAGRSPANRWVAALDLDSSRLWLIVFYPDPGGTLP